MKKILIIGWTMLFSLCLAAQEKYSVVLEKAAEMSPYEAIYYLMGYQQDKPENPNVYYQLGNRCYDLLPTCDPLHQYRELSELLYRSRLFYGNCLHFAKEQKLVAAQYPEIASDEKKLTYAALENYLQPRLKEIEKKQAACDSIHNSFYRLVERYNSCQQHFSQFLSLYTREKTAHLNLTNQQRAELEELAREAEQLKPLIDSYLQALSLEPVKGYNPRFRWQPIELYRLDGLTATDFLQNDVALWDYTQWVERFLEEQKNDYERLYTDVENEYERLTLELKRYSVGARVSDRIDESVVGRCKRLELETPRAQALASMQTLVQLGSTEQQLAESKAPSTRELVPLLQLYKKCQELRKLVTSEEYTTSADSALLLAKQHICRLAQPLAITQQATRVSDINGEVVKYSVSEGEKVHCLLNMTDGWRCAIINTETNETRVQNLNYMLISRGVSLRVKDEQPFVLTAMPQGGWVLVTDKNIYFGD